MKEHLARDLISSISEFAAASAIMDEELAALPFVGESQVPPLSPEEHACGCVTVARVTDRAQGSYPFERRLAIACETDHCAVDFERYVHVDGALIPHKYERWCYHHQKGEAERCPCAHTTCGACGRNQDNVVHKDPR